MAQLSTPTPTLQSATIHGVLDGQTDGMDRQRDDVMMLLADHTVYQ